MLLLPLFLGAPMAQQQPALWSLGDALALLGFVEDIGVEGLDPQDYHPARLKEAISGGDAATLDATASDIFTRVAADLAGGHVGPDGRRAWHISDEAGDPPVRQRLMQDALQAHAVATTLQSLLPSDPGYAALKHALAALPAGERTMHERLRANLDRWRWMPRELGQNYILVNVPSFTLDYVRDGRRVARHRAIVGKPETPTPQFSTLATGVILNPWWEVPPSIIAESVGSLVRKNPSAARAKGYVTSTVNGRLYVRQAPGPGNSLGQMKLDMANPYRIYIHDTPSKELFDRAVRTFSHGCIRIDRPFELAALLLEPVAGWDRSAIDKVASGRTTTRIGLPGGGIPVYVTYFTAVAREDGMIDYFDDVYGRDLPVIAALTDGASVAGGLGFLPGQSECSLAA